MGMNMLGDDLGPNIKDDPHDLVESLNTRLPELDLEYEHHENEVTEGPTNPKMQRSKTTAGKDGSTTK